MTLPIDNIASLKSEGEKVEKGKGGRRKYLSTFTTSYIEIQRDIYLSIIEEVCRSGR